MRGIELFSKAIRVFGDDLHLLGAQTYFGTAYLESVDDAGLEIPFTLRNQIGAREAKFSAARSGTLPPLPRQHGLDLRDELMRDDDQEEFLCDLEAYLRKSVPTAH